MFLTDPELQQLTGYVLPAAQARWLTTRGWRFERNRGGRVIVLRSYAERMLGGAGPKEPEPNFAALGV